MSSLGFAREKNNFVTRKLGSTFFPIFDLVNSKKGGSFFIYLHDRQSLKFEFSVQFFWRVINFFPTVKFDSGKMTKIEKELQKLEKRRKKRNFPRAKYNNDVAYCVAFVHLAFKKKKRYWLEEEESVAGRKKVDIIRIYPYNLHSSSTYRYLQRIYCCSVPFYVLYLN